MRGTKRAERSQRNEANGTKPAGTSREEGSIISAQVWHRARLAGGAAILGVLVWRLGAGPFLEGIRHTSAEALLAALVLTFLTTLCCAWRWRLVAAGLGVDLPLRDAVSACYRSQFLNSALPGGVVGDVHRGVRHGRSAGDLGRGLRSVAWERTAGQSVQLGVTAVVLTIAVIPGKDRGVAVGVGALLVGTVVLLLLRGRGHPAAHRDASADRASGLDAAAHHGGVRQRAARIGVLVTTELREVVLARRVWPGVVVTSVLALTGYVAMFAVAVRSTGASLPVGTLVPLALVVLLAAAVPVSIAGWGPREGGAAWAFGALGLSAAQGVTVAVVYGVLVVVSTLPGAVLLLWDRSASPRLDPDEGPQRNPVGSPVPTEAVR